MLAALKGKIHVTRKNVAIGCFIVAAILVLSAIRTISKIPALSDVGAGGPSAAIGACLPALVMLIVGLCIWPRQK